MQKKKAPHDSPRGNFLAGGRIRYALADKKGPPMKHLLAVFYTHFRFVDGHGGFGLVARAGLFGNAGYGSHTGSR